MNISNTTVQQALDLYNTLFDNEKYTALSEMIASDLHVDRDNLRVADTMNLITDTALSLCQHPHYEHAWLKLATICGQNAIISSTVEAIYSYLLIYQQPTDTRADDFECTAKALLKAYESNNALRIAISCANGVHGWRGRTAYQLLATSDYVIQAAIQLLVDGNLPYIREKLQSGLTHLTSALYEGVNHSETPTMFNFKAMRFPGEHECQ